MKAGDFSEPRRMSGSAYVVLLAKVLRQYASLFFILVFLKIFDSDSPFSFVERVMRVSVIAAGYLVVAAVSAFVSYYFRKYYIKDGKLVFMHGLLNKETTSIPLDRVQSLRTKRGFVYRLLELRGVLFDTLASKTAEIELILEEDDWKALLSRVEMQERVAKEVAKEGMSGVDADETGDAGADGAAGTAGAAEVAGVAGTAGTAARIMKRDGEDVVAGQAVRMSFSNLNLIKGAFCQNHLQGMAVLFAALAAVYNTVTSVDDRAVDHVIDYVGTYAGSLSFPPSAYLAVAVVLYLVIMLMWIGKVFLRYSNMEVRMACGQLTFESGLIARNSSRFQHDKVCTVYVKRNFLEKRLRGSTIMLRQALNATDEKRGADVRIYGSDSEAAFLKWWLGKDYADSPEVVSASSGYGLMSHVVWLDLLLSLVAAVVLICFGLYAWLAVPAAWLLISLVKGLCAVRRSSIVLKEGYVVINNGKFADIRNYIKYSNIEVVRLVSTPFTRYSRRVRLSVSTNGTSFSVRSLKEQDAREIYEMLLGRCVGESVG
ncbi:uncharacterized protein BN796_02154 [Alistipes sp. CAG:831]|nr:uncharacterized protein BN796_02154 [Alistipes sp. CAG:831]